MHTFGRGDFISLAWNAFLCFQSSLIWVFTFSLDKVVLGFVDCFGSVSTFLFEKLYRPFLRSFSGRSQPSPLTPIQYLNLYREKQEVRQNKLESNLNEQGIK